MLVPILIAVPSALPVSLEEAKQHCRIDVGVSEDNDLVTAYISAAIGILEKTLSMKLVSQQWRQDFGGFAGCMRLPFRPVDPDSVTIDYRDAGNVEQTVDSSAFRVLTDAMGSYVEIVAGQSWPNTFSRPDAVSITFDVGVDVADVPPALKAAILMHVALLYANRESVVTGTIATMLPMGYEFLVWPYKSPGV